MLGFDIFLSIHMNRDINQYFKEKCMSHFYINMQVDW